MIRHDIGNNVPHRIKTGFPNNVDVHTKYVQYLLGLGLGRFKAGCAVPSEILVESPGCSGATDYRHLVLEGGAYAIWRLC